VCWQEVRFLDKWSCPEMRAQDGLFRRLRSVCDISLLIALVFASMVSLGCGGGDAAKSESDKTTSFKASGSDSTAESNATIPVGLAAVSPQNNPGNLPVANPALAEPQIDVAELLKPDPKNPLVGSWLGAADLDQQVLQQKLAKLPLEEQTQLLKTAKIFLTYQVAMDFFSDGRLGMVVQFAIDGKEQVANAVGTWKVIQVDSDSMIVELVEQMEGGEATTNQVRLAISPDGQQLARPTELDPQLAVCEPKFVFARIPEDFMLQTEIATQPEVQTLK